MEGDLCYQVDEDLGYIGFVQEDKVFSGGGLGFVELVKVQVGIGFWLVQEGDEIVLVIIEFDGIGYVFVEFGYLLGDFYGVVVLGFQLKEDS